MFISSASQFTASSFGTSPLTFGMKKPKKQNSLPLPQISDSNPSKKALPTKSQSLSQIPLPPSKPKSIKLSKAESEFINTEIKKPTRDLKSFKDILITASPAFRQLPENAYTILHNGYKIKDEASTNNTPNIDKTFKEFNEKKFKYIKSDDTDSTLSGSKRLQSVAQLTTLYKELDSSILTKVTADFNKKFNKNLNTETIASAITIASKTLNQRRKSLNVNA